MLSQRSTLVLTWGLQLYKRGAGAAQDLVGSACPVLAATLAWQKHHASLLQMHPFVARVRMGEHHHHHLPQAPGLCHGGRWSAKG